MHTIGFIIALNILSPNFNGVYQPDGKVAIYKTMAECREVLLPMAYMFMLSRADGGQIECTPAVAVVIGGHDFIIKAPAAGDQI